MYSDVIAILKAPFVNSYLMANQDSEYVPINKIAFSTPPENSVEGKFSELDDGTRIPRIYANDKLEAKRVSALNKLGTRWLYHPANNVKRGNYEEVPITILKRRDFYLTNHFNKVRDSFVTKESSNG